MPATMSLLVPGLQIAAEELVVAVAPGGQVQHQVRTPPLLLDNCHDAICLGLLLGGRHGPHHQIGGQRVGWFPGRLEHCLCPLDVLPLSGQVVEDAQQDGPGLLLGGKLFGVFQFGGDMRILEPLAQAGQVCLGEQQARMLLAHQGASRPELRRRR